MSTEPTTTQQAPPTWGDPQPPAPKWSGRKTLAAAAVAIAIAAIGGVAIYLGTSSNNSAQQSGFGGPGAQGGAGGRMGNFGGGRMGGLADALHGDFTVQRNGSYITERMQRGDVTALSSTSITLKSEDGYTETYTIDTSTQKASNLATGSTAEVLATVNGNDATATSITDGGQSQGAFPGGQNGGPPGGAFPGQRRGGN